MAKLCSRMFFTARLQFNRFISSSTTAFPRRVVVTGILSVFSSFWLPREPRKTKLMKNLDLFSFFCFGLQDSSILCF